SGYKEILLVSVQNSMQFWQKQGFTTVEQEVCNSYGDSAQLMSEMLCITNASRGTVNAWRFQSQ
ncbi:hypothetical protein P781_15970, partial [Vibrio mimicus CAIM 1883]